MSTVLSPPADTVNPFKFLDYYTDSKRDQVLFGGRDSEIREVVAGILKHPCFVLYGRSGLGKTSLLLAGVFPELRALHYSPIHIRLLQDTMADLAAAVRTSLGIQSDETSPEATTTWLELASKNGPVVLAFDQFEEFFTRFRDKPEQQHRFTAYVAGLLRHPTLAVRVVFSLREDYLAELDDFRSDLPDVLAHGFRLRPLSSFGARQTIVRSLVNAGVDYEQKLLTGLVDLIVTNGGLEPTLLQIVCYEIFENAVRRPERPIRLTAQDLEQIGGVDGIYKRYLQDVIKHIDPTTLLLARAVLEALITSDNTKRAVTLPDLLRSGFEASQDEVNRVVEQLVRTRIIRPDRRDGIVWYELAHERLVTPLLEWFSADEWYSNFRRVKSLISDNCRGEFWRENVDLLLGEGVLELASRYQARLRLDPVQSEFMLWSAVNSKSDTLEHWAKACGDDVTHRTLTKLLDNEKPASRSAAAAAVAKLGVWPELRPRLRELALSDPDKTVRRAAGRAVVQKIDDDLVATIRDALQNGETWNAAIELLADAYDMGARHVPIGFTRVALMARVRARHRLWKRYRDWISRRVRAGSRAAFLAAAAWISTIGLGTSALLTWTLEGQSIPVFAGVISVLGVAAATVLGWLATRSAARGMIASRFGWARPVLWNIAPILVLTLVALLNLGKPWWMLGYALGFAGLFALMAGLTAYARPVLIAANELQDQLVRAAAIQFGLPMAGACVVNATAVAIFRRRPEFPARGVLEVVFAVAFIVSLGSFVLSMAFARAFAEDLKASAALEKTGSRRLKLGGWAALASLLALAASYSPNAILPLVDPTKIAADGTIEQKVMVGPGWPDATYVKFDLPDDQWMQLTLPLSTQADTHIDGSEIRTDRDATYVSYMTKGLHQVSFGNNNSWRGFRVRMTFGAVPVPKLTPNSTAITIVPGGLRIVQLPLGHSTNGRWEAVGSIRLDRSSVPGGKFEQAVVRVAFVGDLDTREPGFERFRRTTNVEESMMVRNFYGFDHNLSIVSDPGATPGQSRPFRVTRFATLPLELKQRPLAVDRDWYLPIGTEGDVVLKAVVTDVANPRRPGADNDNRSSRPLEPLVLALDVVTAREVADAVEKDRKDHLERADSTIKSIEGRRKE